MKLTDRIFAIILVAYLLWMCYYNLYCDQKNLTHSQIYFFTGNLSFAIISLRLYLAKNRPIILRSVRNITLTTVIYKLFHAFYILIAYTKDRDLYVVRNSYLMWQVAGVLLVLLLLIIFVLQDFFRK